jgi:hypothetical protein
MDGGVAQEVKGAGIRIHFHHHDVGAKAIGVVGELELDLAFQSG